MVETCGPYPRYYTTSIYLISVSIVPTSFLKHNTKSEHFSKKCPLHSSYYTNLENHI
ncbi:hypothetical protein BPJM79_60043 [Bacillus pumilus]